MWEFKAMSDLTERIYAEAACSTRPGQMAVLEAIAGEVGDLERRLGYNQALGLSAIFMADALGVEGLEEEKAEYDRRLREAAWNEGVEAMARGSIMRMNAADVKRGNPYAVTTCESADPSKEKK